MTWYHLDFIIYLFLYFYFCSYNLGGSTAELLSNITLNDEKWHKLKIERDAQDALLIVDGFMVKGHAPGLMSSLDVDNGLYLGKEENCNSSPDLIYVLWSRGISRKSNMWQFSFYLIKVLIRRGTFCWKHHLNRSSGFKVIAKFSKQ